MVEAEGQTGFREEDEKRLNSGKLDLSGRDPVARSPRQSTFTCPECGSSRVWKDGLRYPRGDEGPSIQRFLCRSCGFRFSESTAQSDVKINISPKPFKMLNPGTDPAERAVVKRDSTFKPSLNDFALSGSEDVGSHYAQPIPILEKELNKPFPYNRECRVCDERNGSQKEHGSPVQMKHHGSGRAGVLETTGMENLAEVTRQKQPTREGTAQAADIKGKIVEFAFHLKKQGRAQGTIKTYLSILSSLITSGANLFNPETVKTVLALNETWNNNTKNTKAIVYNTFADFLSLKWDKPKYKAQRKLPFIPTEQEIDSLIAASPKKTATILQLLKETAARIGEACKLEWIDLNEKAMTITINCPEKNSNPRICKVSPKLVGMLNALPRKSERIFHKTNGKTAQLCLSRARRKAAMKLQNPRINHITHHTLRHWKATMSYHETKDILHVQQLLGHKKLDSTLIYVNLESAIFQTENDNFHVKTATAPEEITKLLEVGFEYVCQKDGLIFLRKRK